MSNMLADIAAGKATAPARNALERGLELVRQHKTDEALSYLEQSLKEKETVQAHMLLAETYMFNGKEDKARKHYESAYKLAPTAPEVLFHLVEFGFHKIKGTDDPILKTLHQIETQIDKLPPENQAQIYYTLAKAYRSLKDYDRDFDYATKGARAKQIIAPFNAEAHEPYFQAIASYFTPALYEEYKDQGINSDLPVFILGMPRSGTTLIEQILHSHKDIVGIGEDTTFMQLLTQKSFLPPLPASEEIVYPYRLQPNESETILSPAEIAKEYDNYLHAKAPNAKRVVNKAISSFIWLGMAPICFPNVKIILCHRDPLDTCVSAYLHNFAGNMQPYTNDLEVLGDYYRCAYDLMDHWKNVMTDNILEVSYEDLLEEQEEQARRIIEFLGLDWDPACLNFHKTDRKIKTASTQQVRQPLHKKSIGRWKNYEKHLDPLKKALQNQP